MLLLRLRVSAATNSASYHKHEVIYFAGDRDHYYFFNRYKDRKFWGRAPVHQPSDSAPLYSRLAPHDMRELPEPNPRHALPTPGQMPKIPESTDQVAMKAPQGGKRLTPEVLSTLMGDWRAVGVNSSGLRSQVDITIREDGKATMTHSIEGQVPSVMQCRYDFGDYEVKMAGDYGKFSMQVVDANEDQLVLGISGKTVAFERPNRVNVATR